MPDLFSVNLLKCAQVLAGLQEKKVLIPQTVTELEECLKERDTAMSHGELSPPQDAHSESRSNKTNGRARLDKRQIEQRIEEDRERHKRLRESIWAVNSEDNKEFERLWDDTSDIGEDDFIAAEEDAYERRRAVRELDFMASR